MHIPSKITRILVLAAAVAVAVPAFAQGPFPLPPIVGESQPYEIVPNLEDAVWSESGGVWDHTIIFPFATFLKPHFVDVNLPPGDKVVVRSQSGRVVEEFTGTGPQDMSTFWGLSGRGELMVVEYHFSSAFDPAQPPFTIDQVIVGDADLMAAATGSPESICTPGDFEDVICYQADPVKWANITASVGVMSVGGNRGGQLRLTDLRPSPDPSAAGPALLLGGRRLPPLSNAFSPPSPGRCGGPGAGLAKRSVAR